MNSPKIVAISFVKTVAEEKKKMSLILDPL